MDDSPFQHGPAGDDTGDHRDSELADRPRGDRAVVSDEAEFIGIESIDLGVRCLAEATSALRNGIEYRLDVSRRRGDDAQDFGCGGLLLERFDHLSMSCRERLV